MARTLTTLFLVVMIVLPLAIFGCKGRIEKMPEASKSEVPEAITQTDEMLSGPAVEPAQTVATETIPPTAAIQVEVKQAPALREAQTRNKDIQRALKNAGVYAGAIDGKLGPKTRKAIEEFQKSKGLKADGRVGPKTWAELAKYLR